MDIPPVKSDISGISSSSGSELGEVGKEKIASLKEAITEIDVMISERERLSKEFSKECEKLKAELDSYLSKAMTHISAAQPRPDDLRKKRIELSEMQLNEQITCWKDLALLRRERRDYKRELHEREDRVKFFDGLMGA